MAEITQQVLDETCDLLRAGVTQMPVIADRLKVNRNALVDAMNEAIRAKKVRLNMLGLPMTPEQEAAADAHVESARQARIEENRAIVKEYLDWHHTRFGQSEDAGYCLDEWAPQQEETR